MSAPLWLRIRNCERTSLALKQALSDTLSATASSTESVEHKTAGVLSERQPNIAKTMENPKSEEMSETNGKENDPTSLIKHINFQKVDGCSFNFSS